jgi:glutamate racemase
LSNKNYCKKIIRNDLQILSQQSIDVITLSSTHLPFLKSLLKKEFPDVEFIDSGNIVAQKIYSKIKYNKSKRNSLKIFTSGNVKKFQINLKRLGIKNKVNFLSF